MQKIIAVFNNLHLAENTMKYAVHVAQQTEAHLVGIFLDDPFYSSENGFDAIPGHPGVDTATRLKYLKMKNSGARVNSVKSFEAKCSAASVRCTVHHENISIRDLIKKSIFADLLIMNVHETLKGQEESFPSSFIKNLLKSTRCPVLLVSNSFSAIENVTLLYDGNPSSVLALKMFNYLFPKLDELKTQIVYAKTTNSSSEIPEDSMMREWVKSHFSDIGYKLIPGDSTEQLLLELKHNHPGSLIIAGAYQRSMLSMWLHPSLADKLIQNLSNPIFIAHY